MFRLLLFIFSLTNIKETFCMGKKKKIMHKIKKKFTFQHCGWLWIARTAQENVWQRMWTPVTERKYIQSHLHKWGFYKLCCLILSSFSVFWNWFPVKTSVLKETQCRIIRFCIDKTLCQVVTRSQVHPTEHKTSFVRYRCLKNILKTSCVH